MAVYEVVATMEEADLSAQRRRFAVVQAAKAGVGVGLSAIFVFIVGKPDRAEWIAIAGLLTPAILALLSYTKLKLSTLESIGLASFAALIGYLVALTGGMSSPLIVWFALVPAEAALAGGRSAVWRAGGAAAIALLTVALIEAVGALPPSRLFVPIWEFYAGSVLAAVMQSALVAIAAQDRQR